MSERESKLVIAFTGNPVDAEIIQNMLEEGGIAATVNNQLMGILAPWQVAAGGFGAVDVLVFDEKLGEALVVVKAFMDTE